MSIQRVKLLDGRDPVNGLGVHQPGRGRVSVAGLIVVLGGLIFCPRICSGSVRSVEDTGRG